MKIIDIIQRRPLPNNSNNCFNDRSGVTQTLAEGNKIIDIPVI